jgi:hypothetical protein
MERRARIFSVKIILGLVGMMVLAGCAGPKSRMAVLSEPPAAATPQSDKATIIFYRSHSDSELISAAVFDVSMEPPRLVGILSSRMKFAYVAEPGIRHFMVVNQAADFMDAELAAGKTYYALAMPSLPNYGSSSWARFSLRPRVATDPDLADELSGLKWGREHTPVGTLGRGQYEQHREEARRLLARMAEEAGQACAQSRRRALSLRLRLVAVAVAPISGDAPLLRGSRRRRRSATRSTMSPAAP